MELEQIIISKKPDYKLSLIKECIDKKDYNIGLLLVKFYLSNITSDILLKNTLVDYHDLITNLSNSNISQNNNIPISDNKVDSINQLVDLSIENTTLDKNIDINREHVIRVYLICNWLSSEELCKLWNKMSKGNYTWNNIKIVWNEPCDYYVIINRPINDSIKFDPRKTIIFRMEPLMNLYPNIWGPEWATPNKNEFLFVGYHNDHYNNCEWHLSKTYNELCNEQITKREEGNNMVISSVLSGKYKDPGHIKRIDFAKFIDTKENIKLHVYGENKFNWKNYKGLLPYHKKDDALLPYKYTFNVENQSLTGYFTEKLIDGILSECLVFYHGCIDIKNYIDERAFVWLELVNFEQDYLKIESALKNNLWEKRLPYIKEAKRKILNEMQFFPRIEKIINDNDTKTSKYKNLSAIDNID